ncbi:NYN domain-containing protein [Brachyspira innocens]|uniref:NYN domain-containing protein n=1 Tax=Brachyspira innocens TaxID=13264 RepID=UPI000382F053|nr:NYN domain-containing protein [Brachyspira innocens]
MKKIGIYIDLENIRYLDFHVNLKSMLKSILDYYKEQLKDEDIVFSIKKAYGDSKSIKKYAKHLRDLHIDIIHSVPFKKAKNMADMKSSLDAFEDFIIYKKIDIIIFVTKDVDYSIVMDKLMRHGCIVSMVTTSDNFEKNIFQNACCHDPFKIEKYRDNVVKENNSEIKIDNQNKNKKTVNENNNNEIIRENIIDNNKKNKEAKKRKKNNENKSDKNKYKQNKDTIKNEIQNKEIENNINNLENKTESIEQNNYNNDYNKENKVIEEKDFWQCFSDEIKDFYDKNENLEISKSYICNKINDKLCQKGESALKLAGYQNINEVIDFLNKNEIKTTSNNSSFTIEETIKSFENKMNDNILNKNEINYTDEINDKNFIYVLKKVLSEDKENKAITLSSVMKKINKEFNMASGQSAIKHTKFKNIKEIILKLGKYAELTEQGRKFIIKDKDKTLETLESIAKEL